MKNDPNETKQPNETPAAEQAPPVEPAAPAPKKPHGFAAMDPEARAALARKGGLHAHQRGTAHRFTTEEARDAGRKGGLAPHRQRGRVKRRKVIETPAPIEMATTAAPASNGNGTGAGP